MMVVSVFLFCTARSFERTVAGMEMDGIDGMVVGYFTCMHVVVFMCRAYVNSILLKTMNGVFELVYIVCHQSNACFAHIEWSVDDFEHLM